MHIASRGRIAFVWHAERHALALPVDGLAQPVLDAVGLGAFVMEERTRGAEVGLRAQRLGAIGPVGRWIGKVGLGALDRLPRRLSVGAVHDPRRERLPRVAAHVAQRR
jgi:hypothetical protein